MSMLGQREFSRICPTVAVRLNIGRALSIVALGLAINGCALWQPMPAVSPAPIRPLAVTKPAPAVLTTAAATALEQARLQVADARQSRTLWKSAAQKLDAAELAATSQDSVSTLRLSKEIIVLCEQSRAQTQRPPVVW
ncbi:MAG: hypothetical protein H7232_19710 [Aeromicrobium sp.]|nr:hypothetical protein [Burkholderiales bacterium]